MAEEKKGFFKRLVSGLTKTRDNIVSGFDMVFFYFFLQIFDDFFCGMDSDITHYKNFFQFLVKIIINI